MQDICPAKKYPFDDTLSIDAVRNRLSEKLIREPGKLVRCNIGDAFRIGTGFHIEPDGTRTAFRTHIENRIVMAFLAALHPCHIGRRNLFKVSQTLRKGHITAVRIRHDLRDDALYIRKASTLRVYFPVVWVRR